MGFYPENVEETNVVRDSVVETIKLEASRLCLIYQKEHKNEVDESNLSEENQIKYNDFNFGDECIKDIGVETYSLFEDEEIDINKKQLLKILLLRYYKKS